MIIRRQQGQLRLATQSDHAALAAELAGLWGGLFTPPEPLALIQLATRIHDEGWVAWDQQPHINPATHTPYDFMNIPIDQHLAIYRRCVALALEADPYAGLLVSLHGSGLYRRRYGYMDHLPERSIAAADRPLVAAFLAEQETLQQQLQARLRPDAAALWTHYRWLQAWDALSVFICLSDPAAGGAFSAGRMPLYPEGPEVEVCIQGAGPDTYRVAPWPFRTPTVTLTLPVRYLPDRPYTSDADLQAALQAAPVEPLTLQIVP